MGCYQSRDPNVVRDLTSTCWKRNGRYHREDGPAIVHINGDLEWWINGKRHREVVQQ